MKTARRVVILVHGIHTSRKDADRWMGGLERFLRERLPAPQQVKSADGRRWATSVGDDIVQFRYGWTSGIMIRRLSFIGWLSRRRRTKKFQKLVARLRRRNSSPLHVDVVAHSFGTWLVYYSTLKGKKRLRTKLGRVAFMAGVVPTRATFHPEAFERVLNLYSREDDVVRLASYAGFGRSGVHGFAASDDAGVKNVDLTPFEHDHYLNPLSKAWDLVADFLRG